MISSIKKSVLLLILAVFICCGVYPLALWFVGQIVFPFESNGSLLKGPDGQIVGSKLIAQNFTKDEYFQPRPSAASYDASASASSSLAASNYALRNRVARAIGPIAKYASGPKAGQLVASDVEQWFQQDLYQGHSHIVAQWAELHSALAQAWVTSDPAHAAIVERWAKENPGILAQFKKDNPNLSEPKPADLAVVFFDEFSKRNPGKFLSTHMIQKADGKTEAEFELVSTGLDIQTMFFDLWRQDHPQIDLQEIPGDWATASASGLDPHISLQNAYFQLERVSSKWASHLKRDRSEIRHEIEEVLLQHAAAPWYGLAGEKFVNVLEVNLELRKRFGPPKDS